MAKTVKLTGLPVSYKMQDILYKLDHKENVEIKDIYETDEIILAETNVLDSTPSYKLKNREPLQEAIKNELLSLGSFTENGGLTGEVIQGKRLDIVIGLPASGKSSAIVETLSEEFNARVIDNDMAKERIPQFNNGWGAGVVHRESQMIEEKVFAQALANGDNIVLPKVGAEAKWVIEDYVKPAKELGYEVNVHYVDLDRNKALGRMLNRFIETGRYLQPKLIEKYAPMDKENHIDVSYEELKQSELVDGYSKWDNDVGRGEKPILVESNNLKGNYISEARKEIMENDGADRKNLQENGRVSERDRRITKDSVDSNEILQDAPRNVGDVERE